MDKHRTAVFIDGAFFSKILRQAYERTAVAYDKLSELVAVPGTLLRTYYYDALPYVSERPTEDEVAAASGKRRFFDALRHAPKLTVREGRVARSWNHDRGDWSYKQKFVDVYLAGDLVRLASKNKIDVAVLVTGDSDFIPAVEIAKDEGVQVRLLCAPNQRDVSHALAKAVDQIVTFDDRMFEAVRIHRAA